MSSKITTSSHKIQDITNFQVDWNKNSIYFPIGHIILDLGYAIECEHVDDKDLIITKSFMRNIARTTYSFSSKEDAKKIDAIVIRYLFSRCKNALQQRRDVGEEYFEIKNDVLYVSNHPPVFLNEIKAFYFHEAYISFNYSNGNRVSLILKTETLDKINTLVDEHFKNKKIVAVFKDVQKNNPMLSLTDAWKLANETVQLLSDNNLLSHY